MKTCKEKIRQVLHNLTMCISHKSIVEKNNIPNYYKFSIFINLFSKYIYFCNFYIIKRKCEALTALHISTLGHIHIGHIIVIEDDT